jgi:hypothetical protein
MNPDQSLPTPEKGPRGESPEGAASFEGAAFALPTGARIDSISSMVCQGMGRGDLEFIVETFTGREPHGEAFEELWGWVTSAPHDTLFARAPTDETLLALASESASWDIGRRTLVGMVEYYASLRVERGIWAGITVTVSHLEGTGEGEKVLFSALVQPGGLTDSRETTLLRLVRLLGLSGCRPGQNGSDLLGYSTTLSDSGEFCLFIG